MTLTCTRADQTVAVKTTAATSAVETTIVLNDDGHYTLMRDGKPYFIYGAGGSEHLDVLVEHGGNSIRTWGIESLEQQVDGVALLDRCEALGITVCVGLWIGHERHGFNYRDPVQLDQQREAVRQAVRKYKDHPAVLMWGLGNEMEGPDSNEPTPHIWKELDQLASIIREEDQSHPIMTVIAGSSPVKVKGILEDYSNVDILGVNSYAAASSVASEIQAAGWKKPFVLTEFGPSGHWEVPTTSWGAAIEPKSREKAASYYVTQTMLIEDAKAICLGSYCFVWGQKQEKTSTWYGMFLPTGEKLPQVDAISRAWTGKWPTNRCPRVDPIQCEFVNATVAPGVLVKAKLPAVDPNEDSMTWQWIVQAESTAASVGGDREPVPPIFEECIIGQDGDEVTLRTPAQPGNYRLFAIVRDGRGGAAAENVCFQVTGVSK
ncbi:glycoside hydrolase family 2 TIM barrel-domain containing protein [Neorhodopirellula pilleata]|nr:glycoside hydrolase family 2 TIM barrel-domain containing protein [Neorhodopirellula pilleata]